MREFIDNPKPSTIATRKWAAANPERRRELNLKHSRTHRKNHKKEWAAYYKAYFAEWLKDPICKRTHQTRIYLTMFKKDIKRGVVMKDTANGRAPIYRNLLAIGWSTKLPKDRCINHKISLWWLYSFRLDLPFIVAFCKCNMEIISRVENNSLGKRIVTEESVKIAQQMEKEHPEWLTGFTQYIKGKIGEKR